MSIRRTHHRTVVGCTDTPRNIPPRIQSENQNPLLRHAARRAVARQALREEWEKETTRELLDVLGLLTTPAGLKSAITKYKNANAGQLPRGHYQRAVS